MRFTVTHLTHYSYSAPVQLAPHILRFTPRPEGIGDLSSILTIDPSPVRRQERTDAQGNTITRVAFDGACTEFRIESRFTLETRPRPFPGAGALPPLPWPTAGDPDLVTCLGAPEADDPVTSFAAGIAAGAGGDPLAFLAALNTALHTGIDRHIRPMGYAQTPAETLQSGRGACRDITVLFITACRSLGIPARFASGYQARAETPDGHRHLHAWPQVHIPGHGWVGLDPTHGIPVSDGHVALAVAPDQSGTMPVEGGFYGAGVASTLSYRVEIDAAP